MCVLCVDAEAGMIIHKVQTYCCCYCCSLDHRCLAIVGCHCHCCHPVHLMLPLLPNPVSKPVSPIGSGATSCAVVAFSCQHRLLPHHHWRLPTNRSPAVDPYRRSSAPDHCFPLIGDHCCIGAVVVVAADDDIRALLAMKPYHRWWLMMLTSCSCGRIQLCADHR